MAISEEDAKELDKELTLPTGIYAPAATVGSAVAHPTPPVLTGTGSPDVFIGGKPAWRGVPGSTTSSQIDDYMKNKRDSERIVLASKTQSLEKQAVVQEAQIDFMIARTYELIASSENTDKHQCVTPWPPIPHGEGIVIPGSETVFINGCRACRQGELVFEPIGLPNDVVEGVPTVLIG